MYSTIFDPLTVVEYGDNLNYLGMSNNLARKIYQCMGMEVIWPRQIH